MIWSAWTISLFKFVPSGVQVIRVSVDFESFEFITETSDGATTKFFETW